MGLQTLGLLVEEVVTFDAEYDNGSQSTSVTVNWQNGQKQRVTMTGNVAITFSAPTAGVGHFQLQLIQDGTGGRNPTWSSSPLWPEGTTPDLSGQTGGGEKNLIGVYYDGANWFCTWIGGAAFS